MMAMLVGVVWSLSKRIKEVIGELSGCAGYPDCRGFGCLVWLFGGFWSMRPALRKERRVSRSRSLLVGNFV